MSEVFGELPVEVISAWDPNDSTIFEQQRDATWLMNTWKEYSRTKYKKVLDKWNKDTGGGDGSASEFYKFCGGDTWLGWIFLVDMDANFLLAHSAAGRMPRHLQVEAGFTEEMSSLEESHGGTDASKKKATMERELDDARQKSKKISETLDEIKDLIKSKEDTDDEEKHLNQMARYNSMLTDDKALNSMTPLSKAKYEKALKRKRKETINKLEI